MCLALNLNYNPIGILNSIYLYYSQISEFLKVSTKNLTMTPLLLHLTG